MEKNTHRTKNIQTFIKLMVIFLFSPTGMKGQDKEIETRMQTGELKMTFPSIYFRHNSTDYAVMPYTADSCFKYIALHIKDINDLVIWRDSLETEKLTEQRIKKLKSGLKKYKLSGIYIGSMGKEQKISRHTIEISDPTQTQYLLSLNSVFDIAKSRSTGKRKYTNHIMHPRISCWSCWINGFHWHTRMKLRKAQKRNEKNGRNK